MDNEAKNRRNDGKPERAQWQLRCAVVLFAANPIRAGIERKGEQQSVIELV